MTDIRIVLGNENSPVYTYFEVLFPVAGFTVVRPDAIDWQWDGAYIVVKLGEYPQPPEDRKAQVVIWELEPFTRPPYPTELYDQVWTFSPGIAKHRGCKFVPMTCHAQYPASPPSVDKTYDVSHISSAVPRRQHIYQQLEAAGVTLSGYGLWGAERDKALASSRMMLNVFPYDDFQVISPIRPNLAAIYRLPLVCESGDVMGLDAVIKQVPYSELVRTVVQECRTMDEMGDELHQYLCVDNPIDKVIAQNI